MAKLQADERTELAFHALYRQEDETDKDSDRVADRIRESYFKG